MESSLIIKNPNTRKPSWFGIFYNDSGFLAVGISKFYKPEIFIWKLD